MNGITIMPPKVVIIGHSYTSRLGIIRSVAQIGSEITVIVMTGFKRDGITLNDIQQEAEVSRRTAERLRDVLLNELPIEELDNFHSKEKHWGFRRSGYLKEIISFSKDEIAELENIKNAISHENQKELLKEIRRTPHTFFEITEMGRKLAETGTVEERMVNFLKEKGAHTMPEIASGIGLEQKDVGSAFGPLVKDGVLKMNAEKKVEYTGAAS